MSIAKLKLPKLKTKDELVKAAPHLARLLADDGEGATVLRAQVHSKSRPRSSNAKLGAGAQRGGAAYVGYDEVTEEERLRAELERVKAERASLLESLAKLHMDQGKSGGSLQQEDIRLLRREIEAKKEKLNELHEATLQGMDMLEQLETTSKDCEQLMPQGLEPLQARVEELAKELATLEAGIVEAEAKNELYKLLEIRTRSDHLAAEQAMRESRELKNDATDDVSTLTKAMYEMRAAKEDAEQQLGMAVMMFDQVRSDWQAKLKDRRKEVRELERRRENDAQRQEQEEGALAEKERAEQDKSARHQRQQEAQQARLSAMAPQLDAMETLWTRLHAITAASSSDDVITCWQDLTSKEANMRELVRLAEVRETRAKEEMASLLGARAQVFDTAGELATATPQNGAVTVTTLAAPAGGEADCSAQLLNEKPQQIASAKRRKQAAKKKFNKLSQICVAAEQGLQLLSERLKAAMSRSAAPSADGGPPTDRRRSSVSGRRASCIRRPSVAGIRRMSAAGFKDRRQSQAHTVLLDAGAATDIAVHVPVGASINERDFFPEMLSLVGDVGDRLNKMLAVVDQMEVANDLQREGAPAVGAQPSSSSEAMTPTKRLQWADRQATPRMEDEADVGKEQGAQVDAAGSPDASSAQANDGEKQLRKGFRRRTWAGPAWVNTVSGQALATALPVKKAVAASGTQHLQRIVGHVEEAGEGSEQQEQQQKFGFESPEGSDDDQLVDRHYLKHRAHKLTTIKARQGGGGA